MSLGVNLAAASDGREISAQTPLNQLHRLRIGHPPR
jgi:hypothetical protein